jgi:hypothetical protein
MVIWSLPAAAGKHGPQSRSYRRSLPRAYARHIFEPTIMCRDLQTFQRIDVERVVYATRRFRSDTGDGLEEVIRLRLAAHAFQLNPATRIGHFVDCAGQTIANVRKAHKSFQPIAFQDCRRLFMEFPNRIGRQTICAHTEPVRTLELKKLGRLFQPVCNLFAR